MVSLKDTCVHVSLQLYENSTVVNEAVSLINFTEDLD